MAADSRPFPSDSPATSGLAATGKSVGMGGSLTLLAQALKRRNKAAMDKAEAPKAANRRKIASVLARIMEGDGRDAT